MSGWVVSPTRIQISGINLTNPRVNTDCFREILFLKMTRRVKDLWRLSQTTGHRAVFLLQKDAVLQTTVRRRPGDFRRYYSSSTPYQIRRCWSQNSKGACPRIVEVEKFWIYNRTSGSLNKSKQQRCVQHM